MKPISILLADDNTIFQDIVIRFLQKQDDFLVIGTAFWSEEALIKALELQPQVVLIDLTMPDSLSLEVIPCIRSALPKSGIIVMTLMDNDHYRQAALAAGANDLVAKTNLKRELLPAIRRTTQRSQSSTKIRAAEIK